MTAIVKDNIRIGFLFSNGKELIYKVTWAIFSELVQYKEGVPTQMNEVHVDIFKEDDEGNLEIVDRLNFLNIEHLYPLPIKLLFLTEIGFKEEELRGESVLKKGNVYFKGLNEFKGVHLLHTVENDDTYPVTSVHEVQLLSHLLR